MLADHDMQSGLLGLAATIAAGQRRAGSAWMTLIGDCRQRRVDGLAGGVHAPWAGSGSVPASESASETESVSEAAQNDSRLTTHDSRTSTSTSGSESRFRSSLAGRLTAAVVLILVLEAVIVAGMMKVADDLWLGFLRALRWWRALGAPAG